MDKLLLNKYLPGILLSWLPDAVLDALAAGSAARRLSADRAADVGRLLR
jgi:hypothetical protein